MDRLYALAVTFPVLRGYAPVDSLLKEDRSGLEILATWAHDTDSKSGRWAAIFVLYIWSTTLPEAYNLPAFDLHAAIGAWDVQQRAAFARWAADPFWC